MNTTATATDVKEMFEEKYRRGIFQAVARHLRGDLVEDRLAEGVAMAFVQYKENAARGHVMADAVLVHACHLRAIDVGRRVAGSQGARAKGGVLDERNYKEERVEVLRLDGLSTMATTRSRGSSAGRRPWRTTRRRRSSAPSISRGGSPGSTPRTG